MIHEDFYDFDGITDIGNMMMRIGEWILTHCPTNPTLTIIAQEEDFLHFRLYMDNHK